jgi:8-oxoguanine deaminase
VRYTWGADILGLDAVGPLAPGFVADLAVYQLDDLRFEAFHDVTVAPVATGIRP